MPWEDSPVTRETSAPVPSIQAQLSVRNGRSAVEFYKAAFGAVELFRHGGPAANDEIVAQLAIGETHFWVEDESPPHGNFSPESVGGPTTRMLLVVDDPTAVMADALKAGATQVNPVTNEHGWLIGRIDDPYGHRWEIGKPTGSWPPAG
jgi:PhnB protein